MRVRREGISLGLVVLACTGGITFGGISLYGSLQRARAGVPPVGAEASALPGFTAAATRGDGGVVVTSVRAGSSAEQAGIRVGDDLAAVDRHSVTSVREAKRYLTNPHVGAVQLRLVRGHRARYVVLPEHTR